MLKVLLVRKLMPEVFSSSKFFGQLNHWVDIDFSMINWITATIWISNWRLFKLLGEFFNTKMIIFKHLFSTSKSSNWPFNIFYKTEITRAFAAKQFDKACTLLLLMRCFCYLKYILGRNHRFTSVQVYGRYYNGSLKLGIFHYWTKYNSFQVLICLVLMRRLITEL